MKNSPVNPIRDRVNQLKEDMNPKSLFVITADDKIIYASLAVSKLMRSDPTGTSFFSYIHPSEKVEIKKKLDNCENIEATRTFLLGMQSVAVEMSTTRELVEGRVIGLTVVKGITIVKNTIESKQVS